MADFQSFMLKVFKNGKKEQLRVNIPKRVLATPPEMIEVRIPKKYLKQSQPHSNPIAKRWRDF